MAVPGLCQLLDPRKGRSLMQINTALQRMGFATWNDLEPGNNENSSLFLQIREPKYTYISDTT